MRHCYGHNFAPTYFNIIDTKKSYFPMFGMDNQQNSLITSVLKRKPRLQKNCALVLKPWSEVRGLNLARGAVKVVATWMFVVAIINDCYGR